MCCTLLVTLMCFSHPGRENMIFFNVLSTTLLLFHERRANFRPFYEPCSHFVRSRYEYIYHFIYYFCITFVFINRFDPIDRSIEWITPLSIDKDLSDWFFLQFYSFLSLLRIHFYQSILHSKSLMENGCRYLVDSIHACNTM